MRLRILVLLAVLAASGGLAGCGDGENPVEEARDRIERLREDARGLRERAEARFEEIRAEARRVGDDLAARVREALDDLERTVPRATPATPAPPSSEGRAAANEVDAFLTDVLTRVDRYWTRTFEANGQATPRVAYVWVPEGRRTRTACGASADDTAAFYCPADDTIYVGRRLAASVIAGSAEGFPGERQGYGRAEGDFGAAYIVAHEYAHNLQQELGFFSAQRRGASARPFELQADCLSGVWGAAVYREGLLEPGDVEEALSTALAVGDFEVGSEQHHGTPEERRDAWLLGFESGEPSSCQAFVRA